MKYISITCLLPVLLVFTAGCPTSKTPSNAEANNEPFEYKDATYPFRFTVPGGWICKEKYENSVVTAFGPADQSEHRPNINVSVMPAEPARLNADKESYEEAIPQVFGEGHTLAFFEKTVLGTHETMHVKLAIETEQTGSTILEQYILNAGQYAYVITCSATSSTYPGVEKTFKTIVESFEFE